jgi:hypothetical protein
MIKIGSNGGKVKHGIKLKLPGKNVKIGSKMSKNKIPIMSNLYVKIK